MRISAVVAVRDEEQMIDGALRLLGFCDEIVVVMDDRTTDRTEPLARRYTEHVHRVPFRGFGSLKNAGVERARGDWIVFCDGDERVTPRLAADFVAELEAGTDMWAFRSPTINFFWGRRMEHGGWRESHVKIVRRDHARHTGDLHERLDVPVERVGWLSGERWHFSHRSMEHNLLKTAAFGAVDAQERRAAGEPRVTALSLFRVLAVEFARRMVRRAAWRDGMPGLIEAFYQPFSLFCTRVMLWERQRGDALDHAYAELERAIDEQV
jgi:glycosyltransferase involved in cell wall biosynthesis